MAPHTLQGNTDEVLAIMARTHRCSFMIENCNSRLRLTIDQRKPLNNSSTTHVKSSAISAESSHSSGRENPCWLCGGTGFKVF
ncbi:hypothetical protein [Spartinivicinus poritis]|uniref:Uncharacterized protein n=1 Tax=Spartinivicinus poritis TaxID=2994640 RepID=A0ABT5UHH5_9GAMM|nr:hypothetical protein [Spartinivicinus sp. A2-2]MDE1464878.1 hypothetical protein [Spartinivicinus sp. A2-2]